MTVPDLGGEDELRNDESCLLCGSHSRSSLYDLQQVSGIPHQVVRCRSCGLVFLQPLPKDEEVEARYLDPNVSISFSVIRIRRHIGQTLFGWVV
ncbi:hypothetical protein [Candidatus Hakubella thermalkaliphila]|uniref:hypothetical protein n=1 Tax=Candidatus Hakubella thermalkaliphila TaxID=2754717 RepID=UPI0015931AEF|nr:hypothetical protein [Candidatus Hakubella thermalkaliphila]